MIGIRFHNMRSNDICHAAVTLRELYRDITRVTARMKATCRVDVTRHVRSVPARDCACQ